jgi:DNA-binding response OmpR family regulator
VKKNEISREEVEELIGVFDKAADSLVAPLSQRAPGVKAKVLIVDDDAAITQQLYWTLCDEFEVLTANDLSTALRRATIYEPDILILDLHLPPTPDALDTGLRILDYVKVRRPTPKIFVISAASGIGVEKACYQHGADVFIGKPIDVERLLSEVRRAAAGGAAALAASHSF